MLQRTVRTSSNFTPRLELKKDLLRPRSPDRILEQMKKAHIKFEE
jgi:hypothetical protein